ncbi:MAG: ABC transporter permease [Opitutales bacterium]|nr:ABC transporter permease [Opitutales bacterium]MCH8540719.1 ABC transporter permease [Opitutales bacterium]
MNLFSLIRRNLRQGGLATALTIVSLSLAVGLLLCVWVLRAESERAFQNSTGPFDAVLGARSAPLQLVLNALFHLEDWPGTIPMEDYQDIAANPAVKHAIPLAGGDNYRGYRIVGTDPRLFSDVEFQPGEPFRLRPGGRLFEPDLQEAVIGSYVADRLELQLGDIFHPYHGLDGGHRHEEEYVVVGILEPTNSPFDRVLWIPLRGIQHMSGHDAALADRLSAVLITFVEGSAAGQRLNTLYNRQGDRLTFAWPVPLVVNRFLERFDWVFDLFQILAWTLTAVAMTTILVALYHAMESRRREIAVFRALGARRATITGMFAGEGFFLALGGVAGGFLTFLLLFQLAGRILQDQAGVVLEINFHHPALLWVPLGVLFLGTLAGLLPGLRAYAMPTSRLLQEKGL